MLDKHYQTGNNKLDKAIEAAFIKDPLRPNRLLRLMEKEEDEQEEIVVEQNKYHVAPVEKRTYNGIIFDSSREMRHFQMLETLQRGGAISDLKRQVKFILSSGFSHHQYGKVRPISYYADFVYYDLKKKRKVVEDAKGIKTKEYEIKRKLFLKIYNEYLFFEV